MDAVCKKLRIEPSLVGSVRIIRQSLDARKKPQLFKVQTVAVIFCDRNTARRMRAKHKLSPYVFPAYKPAVPGSKPWENPFVVVGSGPAGLFAAYFLAMQGYRPVVFERGADMAERIQDVEAFWEKGILNEESNVLFGLGGAGTFSDGKCTSRSKDPRVHQVLQVFIELGASPDIAYQNKPHIGTDVIRAVISRMKQKIEDMGGKFFFHSPLVGLDVEDGWLKKIHVEGHEPFAVEGLLLCTGHSARDTYAMLALQGIELVEKNFAVGLRIEHPQSLIDQLQWGESSTTLGVGAADYKLTYQDPVYQRGVYSFCMCPGGSVVNASSESGYLCVNGMSYAKRDSGRANSALVITVDVDRLEGKGPLKGLTYQRQLEKKAYELGGGGFAAPIQSVRDFLDNKQGEASPSSSVRPEGQQANLQALFDPATNECFKRALLDFDAKMPGFAGEQAVLVGVETRTSSPVRIVRNESFASVSVRNLYPVGEGAGYAGGIVSAAVDGIKAAEKIMEQYRRY